MRKLFFLVALCLITLALSTTLNNDRSARHEVSTDAIKANASLYQNRSRNQEVPIAGVGRGI